MKIIAQAVQCAGTIDKRAVRKDYVRCAGTGRQAGRVKEMRALHRGRAAGELRQRAACGAPGQRQRTACDAQGRAVEKRAKNKYIHKYICIYIYQNMYIYIYIYIFVFARTEN